MPRGSASVADEAPRAPTVFLSYASEDREAARRIGAALPDYGLEVWYDESELGGGDAWDQKIRRQIRECDYFMALVSSQTEARREGYFRREWRLAAERTLDMADDHPFLLPVAIDDTDAAGARVPEKFQSVQWLRAPNGNPTLALETLCRRLATGRSAPAAPRTSIHPGGSLGSAVGETSALSQPSQPSAPTKPSKPGKSLAPFAATSFPVHDPEQSVRFGFEVLGWLFNNGYQLFIRLPRWIRYGVIVYAVVAIISRDNSSRDVDHDLSPETQKKLNAVASQYQKDPSVNLAKLGALVAQQFGDSAQGNGSSVLALPFAGPSGDAAAAKLADSAFAQTYTRISIARHAQLIPGDSAATSCALDGLLTQGRAKHAQYVLCGSVDAGGSAQALSVALAGIKRGKLLWSNQYPVAGADPAKIAVDVAEHVPESEDDD
jgi:TolB-like protein